MSTPWFWYCPTVICYHWDNWVKGAWDPSVLFLQLAVNLYFKIKKETNNKPTNQNLRFERWPASSHVSWAVHREPAAVYPPGHEAGCAAAPHHQVEVVYMGLDASRP